MSKYRCTLCSYSTNDSGNFCKHNQTKRHLKRVEDSETEDNDMIKKTGKAYLCTYCGFKTAHSSSYTKHTRRCLDKKIKDNDLITRLKEAEERAKLLEEKSEIETRERKNIEKLYKDQMENFKELVLETKKGKSSVPALLYEHCENNPHISEIEVSKLDDLIKPKIKLIKEIISRFRHKTLYKFLGDFIVSVYKKEDVNSQSIFSTDTSRMNYMIKELLFDKTSNWILDKKGVKATRYLITPVIEHTRKLISEYSETLVVEEGMKVYDIEKIVMAKRELIDILNEIDDGKLCEKINRYISPLLKMERCKMKKLEKSRKDLPVLEYDSKN